MTGSFVQRLGLGAALTLASQRLAGYAGVVGALLLLWQAVVVAFGVPDYLLPRPAQAAAAFAEHLGVLGHATGLTVQSTLLGLVAATVVAVLLALLFLASPLLDAALMPLVLVVRTVPMIAIAPVLVLLFGRERWNGVGMVALLSFFQIMLAARKGLQAPTRHMLELMHCCGAGFWPTLWKLRVPCALTHLFTGLRIASASAVLCAMFAEWLSGAPGLGSLILDAHSRQHFALMWAAVGAGTTLSYLFYTFTIALERAVQHASL
ncbi:ABC transporter permease [Aquabacterium sp. J223]|uniref:ABC transporter permease n=1 Tax=Aquabacterium sp. J223 TaxID=2898431 RepID=UPI0021AE13A6|nr:ABC transporter permease subunit [Aquabacterium sp. J223]UUX96151.1 ABC transporter permease subunit [Aquabacterium sp. J223]